MEIEMIKKYKSTHSPCRISKENDYRFFCEELGAPKKNENGDVEYPVKKSYFVYDSWFVEV